MVSKKYILIAVVVLLCLFMLFIQVSKKKPQSDEFDGSEPSISEDGVSDSGFDIYDEIKLFMDRQTSYVMGT